MVHGDEGSGNPGRRRGRMEEERRIRKRRRREEEGQGRRRGRAEEREGGENERMGRRGGVLGDAGSRNPGRRPRVPASKYNKKLRILNFTFSIGACDLILASFCVLTASLTKKKALLYA